MVWLPDDTDWSAYDFAAIRERIFRPGGSWDNSPVRPSRILRGVYAPFRRRAEPVETGLTILPGENGQSLPLRTRRERRA